MSGAVHNVSVDSQALTLSDINGILESLLTDHLQLMKKSLLKLTNQKTPIVDVETTEESSNESDEENVSIPSDVLNSLEQHLLDSRKRRLEAERKVEELSEEIERLRNEMKQSTSTNM